VGLRVSLLPAQPLLSPPAVALQVAASLLAVAQVFAPQVVALTLPVSPQLTRVLPVVESTLASAAVFADCCQVVPRVPDAEPIHYPAAQGVVRLQACLHLARSAADLHSSSPHLADLVWRRYRWDGAGAVDFVTCRSWVVVPVCRRPHSVSFSAAFFAPLVWVFAYRYFDRRDCGCHEPVNRAADRPGRADCLHLCAGPGYCGCLVCGYPPILHSTMSGFFSLVPVHLRGQTGQPRFARTARDAAGRRPLCEAAVVSPGGLS